MSDYWSPHSGKHCIQLTASVASSEVLRAASDALSDNASNVQAVPGSIMLLICTDKQQR
jgi:hypothetical protein